MLKNYFKIASKCCEEESRKGEYLLLCYEE